MAALAADLGVRRTLHVTDATNETSRPMAELVRKLQDPLAPRRRGNLADTVRAALAVGPPILVLAVAWIFVAFVGVTLLGGSIVCGMAIASDARNAAVVGDARFLFGMGMIGFGILATLGVMTTGAAWLLVRNSTSR
jgi:hypothetical protein